MFRKTLIATLFIVVKRQKQSKCPAMTEQVYDEWHIHTTGNPQN